MRINKILFHYKKTVLNLNLKVKISNIRSIDTLMSE